MMDKLMFLWGMLITALLGLFYTPLLYLLFISALGAIIYNLWYARDKSFHPQSDTYKALQKIKKRRKSIEKNRYRHIKDQIDYIEIEWGYSQTQQKITSEFLSSYAYEERYNFLTASLLPQIISAIEYCNTKNKKGCKRDISKRIRDLTNLMKSEIRKNKSVNYHNLEVSLEVYDELFKELSH